MFQCQIKGAGLHCKNIFFPRCQKDPRFLFSPLPLTLTDGCVETEQRACVSPAAPAAHCSQVQIHQFKLKRPT